MEQPVGAPTARRRDRGVTDRGRGDSAQPAWRGHGFGALPLAFWSLFVAVVVAYLTVVEIAKRLFEAHVTPSADRQPVLETAAGSAIGRR